MSMRKQTIYRCDACGNEQEWDDGLPTKMTPGVRWHSLAPFTDGHNARHLCSLGCVVRMAEAAMEHERGHMPLTLRDDA